MPLGTLVAALWLAQAAPAAPPLAQARPAPEAAPPVAPPEAPPPQAVPPAQPVPAAPPSPPAAPMPPAPPAKPGAPAAAKATFPPPARVGFQGALAVQGAFPAGHVRSNLDLSDLVMFLVEFEAQAGVKLDPRWFVGGYLGGGVGAPGKGTVDLCDEFDRSCTATSVRVGVLGRLDLTPADAGNLWVGAGLGGQWQRTDVAARTATGISVERADLSGGEVRFMAGVDYRATRVFGFGLFGALSLGWYGDVELPGGDTVNDVGHVWFTAGARGVLFP